MADDQTKFLNAYENTVSERKRIGQNNFRTVYLGTKCRYDEGHPVAVVPLPEHGHILSRSAIAKIRSYLNLHEEKHDELKEIKQNKDDNSEAEGEK